jgi:PAS domain S-box-containing protein
MLSAITDFVYFFDRDGRFLYANKALLDLWGLALEAVVGKNFFDSSILMICLRSFSAKSNKCLPVGSVVR